MKAGGEGDGRGRDGWMASPTNGHEFEQTPGVGEGQGSLECFNLWGCKEWETTEGLNWTGIKVGEKKLTRRLKKEEEEIFNWLEDYLAVTWKRENKYKEGNITNLFLAHSITK